MTEPDNRQDDSRPTVRRFARGAGWLYSYRWVERLLDFLAIVILARLLSPEDFGLVAIAASIVAIIDGLAALDVNKALIRHRDVDRDLFDSAWTLSVLRGVLSALIMVGLAPLFTDPRLGAILCVLALSPLLAGLINPLFSRFESELAYAKVAQQTLVAKGGSFLATVGLALAGVSYWALVAGTLVNTLLITTLSYLLRPYRPRFSKARFREIFGFSGWLSLTTAVTTLSMETDKLIVGKLLGVTDTGRYFMTQRLGVLPTRELISPLQRLLFPSFSELLPEPARLRRVVLESINVLGSLSLPAGVGFALVAADFVPLALGDQWLATIPLLVVLVPYLGIRGTLAMTLPCVLALGRTRLLFGVSTVYALVHIPVFVGATASFGLLGSIWSLVVAGAFYTWLNAWMLRTTLGIRPSEILRQLLRPALGTLVMALGLLALSQVPAIEALSPLPVLLIKSLTGGALFASCLYGFWWASGRPPGIERRVLQLLQESRPSD